MSLDDIVTLLAAILVLLGAFLSLAAGVGLVRFPDALSRLHAATKPQILGLVFILAAIALTSRSWTVLFALIPVLILQLLTSPIAAHMVGRSAYRTGNFRGDLMHIDELEPDVERASKS